MSPGYHGYVGSDRPLLRPELPRDAGYYEVSGDTGGVILHELKLNKSNNFRVHGTAGRSEPAADGGLRMRQNEINMLKQGCGEASWTAGPV